MIFHGVPVFRGALALRTTSVSFPQSTVISIPMSTTLYDTDGFWSSTANPERLSIPTGLDGNYLVSFGAAFSANALGHNSFYLGVYNSAGTLLVNYPLKYHARKLGTGTDSGSTLVTGPIPMSGGDYVALSAYQDAGGTQNVLEYRTYLGITKI